LYFFDQDGLQDFGILDFIRLSFLHYHNPAFQQQSLRLHRIIQRLSSRVIIEGL